METLNTTSHDDNPYPPKSLIGFNPEGLKGPLGESDQDIRRERDYMVLGDTYSRALIDTVGLFKAAVS